MTFGTGLYDRDRMIVPIAIREDLLARVQIPTDLTRAEAEKIAAVVLAYASAGEAGTAEARSSSVHEHATAEGGDAQ